MEIIKYDSVMVTSRDAKGDTLYSVVKNKPFDVHFTIPEEFEDESINATLCYPDGNSVVYNKAAPIKVDYYFTSKSSKSSTKLSVQATVKICVLTSQCEGSNFTIKFELGDDSDDTQSVFSAKIRSVSKKSQLSAQPKRKRTTQLATRESVLQALSSFGEMMVEQKQMMEELRQQNEDLRQFNMTLLQRLDNMVTVIPSSPDQEALVEQPLRKRSRIDDSEEQVMDCKDDEDYEPIDYGNIEDYPLEFGELKFY